MDKRRQDARCVISEVVSRAVVDSFDREVWSSVISSRFDCLFSPEARNGQLYERTELADIELEVLQQQIGVAKRLRNKTRRACQLPPEILGSIFMFAQEDWNPQRTTTENRRYARRFRTAYSLGWMTVLHTCSTWRQVSVYASPSA